MRRASVLHRLDRLIDRGHGGNCDQAVREVAAQRELGSAEVRTGMAVIEGHDRRLSPSTAEPVARRRVEVFDPTRAEPWAEADRITGPAEARP